MLKSEHGVNDCFLRSYLEGAVKMVMTIVLVKHTMIISNTCVDGIVSD